MSLLKWKELAKRKSELGNKINYVHDTITKQKLGVKTSQESLAKVFKPVTTKLDDVIVSNLKIPNRKLKRGKKVAIPDYVIDIDDEFEDLNLNDLLEDDIQPEINKQLVPKPPTYEESLKDVLEEKKQIYMNPDVSPYEAPPPPPQNMSTLKMMMMILTMLWIKKTSIMRYWMILDFEIMMMWKRL